MTTLHLLDSATGRPSHSWKFDNRPLIRIGRSEGNDIIVPDIAVSRFHVELHYRGTHWEVVNLGRNGLFIGGRSVSETAIEDQTSFRLGPAGPRFRLDTAEAEFDGMNTLMGSAPLRGPVTIAIDEAQKNQQVKEIAESEYFQQLKLASSSLRRRPTGTGEPAA